jgi:DNA repair photolyase
MKEEKEKIPFGTEEWCSKTTNFISGCQNDCKYCYAKQIAIRFGRKTPATWINEEINHKSLNQKFKKIDGRVMYPSTHDITPTNLHYSIQFLKNVLSVGNEVLIVTKPHLEVVKALCEEFVDYKDKIIFRFTIGSSNSEILSFWEPNATSYEERRDSVIFAFASGFQTSLSCEPMLDDNVEGVVNELQNYITETIWVGKMNFLKGRLAINGYSDSVSNHKADELIAMQSDDKILALYQRLKDNPKIQWKESIKKVLMKNQIIV